jgi:hypothetical protein
MRTAVLVLLVSMVAPATCTDAQSLSLTNGLAVQGLKGARPLATAPLVLLRPKMPLQSSLALTNFPARVVVLARTNAPASSTPPKPGIYETAPFTGIVIVPGPELDDRAIIRLPEPSEGMAMPTAPMPILKPELRFIPWPGAKKNE